MVTRPTLISGRDNQQGTEEDQGLHPMQSDQINVNLINIILLTTIFTSLRNIHTRKAFDLSSFTERIHLLKPLLTRLLCQVLNKSPIN